MLLEIFMITIGFAVTVTCLGLKKVTTDNFFVGIGGAVCVGFLAGVILTGIIILFGEIKFITLTLMGMAVVLMVGVLIFLLWFFRDPERVPPNKDGIIISPADGRIAYIKKIEKDEIPVAVKGKNHIHLDELTKTPLLDGGGYLIGIVMDILDVHVNRAPISGQILLSKHSSGKFLSYKNIMEAEIQNERNTTVIDNGYFKVGVVQIASRIVKRIVSYVNKGDFIKIGDRMGMIKFGSLVDIILPKMSSIKIMVSENERVYAGLSILAEYNEDITGMEEEWCPHSLPMLNGT